MARILLAWELGAGLGHVAPLRVLARELRQRGHACVFALRDLAMAEEFLEPELGPVVQAPLNLGAIHHAVKTQVSYASLLHNTGFDDAAGLAARLRAWREIVHTHACDLVITDHAPTAVVAAWGLHRPALQLGTGFTVPPVQQPFPLFREDLKVDRDILLNNEAAVLEVLARAHARLQLPAPDTLQQPFSHAHPALLTYVELDHYCNTRSGPYLGLPHIAQGAAPQWPAGNGPRLFAYLRPSKQFHALLAALQRLPARVLVRVGDIAADTLRGFERPGLRITEELIDLRQAAADCDAFVGYGAHGATAEMLLAGKPVLLVPNTQEQGLVALRAQQLGAGLTPPLTGSFNLSAALRQLLDDAALKKAAENFAARHAQQARGEIIPDLARHALGLIKTPSRDAPADS
ncbi:MAG TPA: nucleotide disphospho-sugar-binding domain-containing protein [Stenotrophobium sp.]|nr:nucleotide disphospho-sugar-binding domain-containing protein [Stenotrophobium sp.]